MLVSEPRATAAVAGQGAELADDSGLGRDVGDGAGGDDNGSDGGEARDGAGLADSEGARRHL